MAAADWPMDTAAEHRTFEKGSAELKMSKGARANQKPMVRSYDTARKTGTGPARAHTYAYDPIATSARVVHGGPDRA